MKKLIMLGAFTLSSALSFASNGLHEVKKQESNQLQEIQACYKIAVTYIDNDTLWKLEIVHQEYFSGTAAQAEARKNQIVSTFPPNWAEDAEGMYIGQKVISPINECGLSL